MCIRDSTRIKGADGRDRLVGDVAFDEVQHARAVTPVPGGVGPMTIACLLSNTVRAARGLTGDDGADDGPAAPSGDEWADIPYRQIAATGEG